MVDTMLTQFLILVAIALFLVGSAYHARKKVIAEWHNDRVDSKARRQTVFLYRASYWVAIACLLYVAAMSFIRIVF